MIFVIMNGIAKIECRFMGLTQRLQADSYGIATWGECRNCAVNCTILGPERNYWYRNISILKWQLRTGTGHVLQENPGT